MKRSTRKQRVISVGKGRGFVIETDDRHLVVTAAHCLPKFPPPASITYTRERTYRNLLGAIDTRRTVWTECLFVDPVADIAVLDTPDTQELSDKVGAYERLVKSVVPLRVSELHGATAKAQLLPLDDGPSFRRFIRVARRGSLWIEEPEREIEGGMSGSPILAEDGSSIGVLVTTEGPQPGLASHLPGWLLGEVGCAVGASSSFPVQSPDQPPFE